MSEDDEDLPRLLGGRYRLEAVLGHGGMGVVYRGADLMMKRPIAVKLIRAIDGIELDDEVAGRFLREAKNTARVQHPNIVQVFDLGRTDEGALYLVMELLDGESLSARMRREGAMSPARAVYIARQICDALEVAHTAGVIHRDLKPANVMLLSRGGDDSFVKVLDFGVAKSYSPDQQTQLTHVGMLVGTVDYMAPEQIMGKKLDGRADVYSLGIVLYKMLAGRAPFRDAGVPALINAHLNEAPKPLAEVATEIPAELERAVLRCLEKDPGNRYASMRELERALGDAVADGAAPLSNGGSHAGHERPLDPYSTDEDNPTVARPLELPPAADDGFAGAFGDATVKMDRSLGFKPASPRTPLPMIPRGMGTTGVGRREPRVDDGAPKKCVMCQTVNAPHARVCAACGVSLAPDEQAALQARVRAVSRPRSSSTPPGPQITGPLPPPYDQVITGPVPQAVPPQAANARRPAVTGPQMPPPNWAVHTPTRQAVPSHSSSHSPGVPPPPQPSLSMWERFLTWTGLRSR
jgi:serine/threonine-protein kinase